MKYVLFGFAKRTGSFGRVGRVQKLLLSKTSYQNCEAGFRPLYLRPCGGHLENAVDMLLIHVAVNGIHQKESLVELRA